MKKRVYVLLYWFVRVITLKRMCWNRNSGHIRHLQNIIGAQLGLSVYGKIWIVSKNRVLRRILGQEKDEVTRALRKWIKRSSILATFT
jgi:hypothetical protein